MSQPAIRIHQNRANTCVLNEKILKKLTLNILTIKNSLKDFTFKEFLKIKRNNLYYRKFCLGVYSQAKLMFIQTGSAKFYFASALAQILNSFQNLLPIIYTDKSPSAQWTVNLYDVGFQFECLDIAFHSDIVPS